MSYKHQIVNEINERHEKNILKFIIIAKLKMVIMKWRIFFSNSKWKLKAIERSKEINSLNKRIKELIISREKIRIKNGKLSAENNELEEKIREIEHELKKN